MVSGLPLLHPPYVHPRTPSSPSSSSLPLLWSLEFGVWFTAAFRGRCAVSGWRSPPAPSTRPPRRPAPPTCWRGWPSTRPRTAALGRSRSAWRMFYRYGTLRASLPLAVEVLLDCVGNAAFLRSQVRCKVAESREELSFLESNPELFLRESLHRVGYSGALGNPLFPTKEALGRIDRGAIRNLFFENYTADRLVLAASGVNHQYLLDTAAPLLSDLPKGNPVHKPKSAYTGGDFRHKTDSETLMGGGASFSNGGPGKGLQSRLYIDGWRSFILQWWSRERIAVPALEVVNPL